MGIRKITFDNGDIVLAKDQAILYDLLLKQQTKTLLPNGENIYQNSTGFLIQNESEKLKYTYKITNDGVEFTFNPQLYLSICGRIIKLEKNTKLLVNKNDVADNESYYIVIKVDLNKEAKIINAELKEFGNPIEIEISNPIEIEISNPIEIEIIKIVSWLTQDNLNQKPNNGIYEFPLISFKAKFKKDIYDLENIENIKDKSKYLLPLLMESTRNPSKLLTITQKIQEEKELLQEKQNQLKNIKNYLTNLEYQKMQELEELEKYIKNQLRKFKKVYSNEKPFKTVDNKWYIVIWRISKNDDWNISKFINWQNDNLQGIDLINNHRLYRTLNSLEIKKEPNYIISNWNNNNSTYFKYIYRWDGKNEPNTRGKNIDFFDLIK